MGLHTWIDSRFVLFLLLLLLLRLNGRQTDNIVFALTWVNFVVCVMFSGRNEDRSSRSYGTIDNNLSQFTTMAIKQTTFRMYRKKDGHWRMQNQKPDVETETEKLIQLQAEAPARVRVSLSQLDSHVEAAADEEPVCWMANFFSFVFKALSVMIEGFSLSFCCVS